MYSNNISHIYDMTVEYYRLRQGDTDLSQYFSMKFLSRLHPEYESVRNQILAKTELPTLVEAYQRVSHALLDHGTPKTTPLVENTALVSTQQPSSGHSHGGRSERGGYTWHSLQDMHIGTLIWFCILLVVYVDDIIINKSDYVGTSHLNTFLQSQLVTKDLSNLKFFHGIEVAHSNGEIVINQRKYTLYLFA
ncbi:unnamed protein product [Spirodela intermedia]|uniref:Uncharacterized protein n=2 Tax=Spirodela intermedia TaxID=51605 RepID=A0A7I8IIA2_SPIIN|nr:unnamed protein product [Spirodela intermedia]CAA6657591.1 unnamed protein product [Spirodela intermedia]CAA7393674.1 unnamed protein product [Spirodela intermedia]